MDFLRRLGGKKGANDAGPAASDDLSSWEGRGLSQLSAPPLAEATPPRASSAVSPRREARSRSPPRASSARSPPRAAEPASPTRGDDYDSAAADDAARAVAALSPAPPSKRQLPVSATEPDAPLGRGPVRRIVSSEQVAEAAPAAAPLRSASAASKKANPSASGAAPATGLPAAAAAPASAAAPVKRVPAGTGAPSNSASRATVRAAATDAAATAVDVAPHRHAPPRGPGPAAPGMSSARRGSADRGAVPLPSSRSVDAPHPAVLTAALPLPAAAFADADGRSAPSPTHSAIDAAVAANATAAAAATATVAAAAVSGLRHQVTELQQRNHSLSSELDKEKAKGKRLGATVSSLKEQLVAARTAASIAAEAAAASAAADASRALEPTSTRDRQLAPMTPSRAAAGGSAASGIFDSTSGPRSPLSPFGSAIETGRSVAGGSASVVLPPGAAGSADPAALRSMGRLATRCQRLEREVAALRAAVAAEIGPDAPIATILATYGVGAKGEGAGSGDLDGGASVVASSPGGPIAAGKASAAGASWRGRSQQIVLLKARVRQLEVQLADSHSHDRDHDHDHDGGMAGAEWASASAGGSTEELMAGSISVAASIAGGSTARSSAASLAASALAAANREMDVGAGRRLGLDAAEAAGLSLDASGPSDSEFGLGLHSDSDDEGKGKGAGKRGAPRSVAAAPAASSTSTASAPPARRMAAAAHEAASAGPAARSSAALAAGGGAAAVRAAGRRSNASAPAASGGSGVNADARAEATVKALDTRNASKVSTLTADLERRTADAEQFKQRAGAAVARNAVLEGDVRRLRAQVASLLAKSDADDRLVEGLTAELKLTKSKLLSLLSVVAGGALPRSLSSVAASLPAAASHASFGHQSQSAQFRPAPAATPPSQSFAGYSSTSQRPFTITPPAGAVRAGGEAAADAASAAMPLPASRSSSSSGGGGRPPLSVSSSFHGSSRAVAGASAASEHSQGILRVPAGGAAIASKPSSVAWEIGGADGRSASRGSDSKSDSDAAGQRWPGTGHASQAATFSVHAAHDDVGGEDEDEEDEESEAGEEALNDHDDMAAGSLLGDPAGELIDADGHDEAEESEEEAAAGGERGEEERVEEDVALAQAEAADDAPHGASGHGHIDAGGDKAVTAAAQAADSGDHHPTK